MIDYAITRQRDIKDVLHTRSMCGSSTWSDHKLVKCKLALRMKTPRHTRRQQSAKKLNIAKLMSTALIATARGLCSIWQPWNKCYNFLELF